MIFDSERYIELLGEAESEWFPLVCSPHAMAAYVGTAALRARYGLSYGYSGPLPDNQWQLETEHWTKGMLASLQDAFVITVGGFPEEVEDFRDPPEANHTVARDLCRNQKIMSTDYSSFSLLSVSLILALGCGTVILDIGVEPALAWWQRRRFRRRQCEKASHRDIEEAYPRYKSFEWSQISTLKLQRIAHEEAGFGVWSCCNGDTPVTRPGQQLATLDLYDVDHPTLKSAFPLYAGPDDAKFINRRIHRVDTGLQTLVEGEGIPRSKDKQESRTP